MDKVLKAISSNMVERYSSRFKKLGLDVKTLGWGSEVQQTYRFSQTIDFGIDFNHKSILDIGCGFGDYYEFLKDNSDQFAITRYTGYDLNPDLIEAAEKKFAGDASWNFVVDNILDQKTMTKEADIGLMLGVLNLNLENQIDNYKYSEKIIYNAFNLVKECLIIDFLSSHHDKTYPKEDFVFYHDPSRMLDFALQLSSNVRLKHNYAPIPQNCLLCFLIMLENYPLFPHYSQKQFLSTIVL